MVRTTFEMDGLFSQEDIDNRYRVMKQCMKCNKWTEQTAYKDEKPCHNCGAIKFLPKSATSLRTFNPNNKRNAKKERKSGW